MASSYDPQEIPSGLEYHAEPPNPNDKFVSSVPRKAVGAGKPGAASYPLNSYPQGGNYTAYPAEQNAQPRSRERVVPCGLGPVAFAAVVALITAIVVGAALGGGLGASLATAQARESSSPSSTSTAATTTTAGATAPITVTATVTTGSTASATAFSNYAVLRPTAASDTVALACPALDHTNYTTVRGQTFNLTCGAALTSDDLGSMLAYVVDDCIEACSAMNAFQASNVCIAVSFDAGIYQNWNQHANCWFKNALTAAGAYPYGGLVAQLT